MFGRSLRGRETVATMFVALALPLVVTGCSSPTEPPAPPTGGSQLVLSYASFASTVEPALTRRGCDAEGDCHGGGIRGTFQLSPPGAKNSQFDFDQASLQVWGTNRDSSPLLLKPLAAVAGGTPHAYKPFASTADTDYVAIRSWIQAGTIQ